MRPILPEAIYLDTNILSQLNHGKVRVDFVELRAMAKNIKANFFIPEIVFKERVNQIIRGVFDEIEKRKSASRRINRLLERELIKDETLQVDIESDVKHNVMKLLKNASISIITTPRNIPLDVIIEMAIKRVAPFETVKVKGEEKEVLTGFNDTIILLTIIEYMKKNGISNTFFISSDKVFQRNDVVNRFKDNGLNVSVLESVSIAKDNLKTSVNKVLQSFIEKKNAKIKDFLEKKKNEVFKYIEKNAVISEFYVMGRGVASVLKGIEPVGDIFESILDTKPKGISSVSSGWFSGKKVTEKNVEQITFSVDVEFRILIKYVLPTKQKFISLATLEECEEYDEGFYERDERVVERDITVEALLHKKNDEYDSIEFLRTF